MYEYNGPASDVVPVVVVEREKVEGGGPGECAWWVLVRRVY